MSEKYHPTAHDMHKAEGMMDDHQKAASHKREKTYHLDKALDTILEVGNKGIKTATDLLSYPTEALIGGLSEQAGSAITRGYSWAADSLLGFFGLGNKSASPAEA